MCGACGTRTAGDWASPVTSGIAARAAVAAALARLTGRVRPTARPGGWLLTGPTGSVTSCATLTELVTRARATAGPNAAIGTTPDTQARSGPLTLPPRDHRRPVIITVGPLPGHLLSPNAEMKPSPGRLTAAPARDDQGAAGSQPNVEVEPKPAPEARPSRLTAPARNPRRTAPLQPNDDVEPRPDTEAPSRHPAVPAPERRQSALDAVGLEPLHLRRPNVDFEPTPDAEAPSRHPAVPAPAALVAADSVPAHPVQPALDIWRVETQDEARGAVRSLASAPQAARHYLGGLHGVTADWGCPALAVPAVADPRAAADLAVWLEWARQEGRFDSVAVELRVPLSEDAALDVEVRAGLVVRARPVPVRAGCAAAAGAVARREEGGAGTSH
ncbi:hypothetical protein [Streptomyces sp. NPDC087212]|uniref:hypothetical protein n=1 Tax=Streptomyces sp. NPDC087212 TaxID=3365766 RepID=UPI0037F839DC